VRERKRERVKRESVSVERVCEKENEKRKCERECVLSERVLEIVE